MGVKNNILIIRALLSYFFTLRALRFLFFFAFDATLLEVVILHLDEHLKEKISAEGKSTPAERRH
jgi:hypothetical protein